MEFFFNFYLLIAGYCPQMNRLYTQKYRQCLLGIQQKIKIAIVAGFIVFFVCKFPSMAEEKNQSKYFGF